MIKVSNKDFFLKICLFVKQLILVIWSFSSWYHKVIGFSRLCFLVVSMEKWAAGERSKVIFLTSGDLATFLSSLSKSFVHVFELLDCDIHGEVKDIHGKSLDGTERIVKACNYKLMSFSIYNCLR